MKNRIKKIFLICFSVMILETQVVPVYATPVEQVVFYEEAENSIEPRTDIKEWIYAEINGSLYKRLYNYTRNRWEGDWILVQQGI